MWTPARVAGVVGRQFPELAPVRAAFLNAGCDSAAFLVNDAWVFRFPTREDVERQLAVETAMLARFEERSPLAVPAFRFHGQRDDDCPFRFAGYAMIPGIPAMGIDPRMVPPGAVASSLARFLTWLHAVPHEAAARLGVPEEPLDAFVEAARAEALDDFAIVAGAVPEAPLDEWHRFLRATPKIAGLAHEPAVLLHNDFAAEHVLVDEKTRMPTGIVDWSDMARGHPVADFAGVCHWGGDPLLRAVIAEYGTRTGEPFAACARYLGACRGVGDVVFGVARNRPEYVRAGVRALELCASRSESLA